MTMKNESRRTPRYRQIHIRDLHLIGICGFVFLPTPPHIIPLLCRFRLRHLTLVLTYSLQTLWINVNRRLSFSFWIILPNTERFLRDILTLSNYSCGIEKTRSDKMTLVLTYSQPTLWINVNRRLPFSFWIILSNTFRFLKDRRTFFFVSCS